MPRGRARARCSGRGARWQPIGRHRSGGRGGAAQGLPAEQARESAPQSRDPHGCGHLDPQSRQQGPRLLRQEADRGQAARDVHNVLIGAGLCAIGLSVTCVWAPEITGISLNGETAAAAELGRAARDFPARGGQLAHVPLRTRSAGSGRGRLR